MDIKASTNKKASQPKARPAAEPKESPKPIKTEPKSSSKPVEDRVDIDFGQTRSESEQEPAVLGAFMRNFGREELDNGTSALGLDLSGDNQFNPSEDVTLARDFDGDGKINSRDIERSRNLLYSQLGVSDFNGSGSVNKGERRAFEEFNENKKFRIDTDGDGRLSGQELADFGFQGLIDQDGDGQYSKAERFGLDELPSQDGPVQLDGLGREPTEVTIQLNGPPATVTLPLLKATLSPSESAL